MVESVKLSRRERERRRHKAEILDAATELFSEKGFHNVSMNEIASEAEFATGTLYNFFPSKEALYGEIMDNVAGNVLSVLTPILEGASDEKAKLMSYFAASVRIFHENAAAIRLLLRANQGRPPTQINAANLGENASRIHDSVHGMLRQVVASGIEKGLFRALDPDVVALALDAALRTVVFSVAEDANEDALQERVSNIEKLFFRGILHA